jgi:MFS family permease
MLSSRHISIYMGGFIGPLSGLAVLALLPVLKDEFAIGIEMIQLSIPVFMLPFAFFQFFSGTVSDRIGRGGILVGGFIVHSLGSFLCALSPDFNVFLAGRFVQGIGYAFVSPVLAAMIGDITEGRKMGSAMGIFGAAITLGIATGPLMAGIFEPIDWRLAFYLFAALSLIEIVVLFGTFGASFASSTKDKARVIESVTSVLSNKNVLLLSGAGFVAFFSYIGTQTYMADHWSDVFTPQEISYILSSAGLVGIFWAPVSGRLVDRIGRIPVGAAGFTLLTVTMLALMYADPLWSFLMIFGIIGVATASIWSSLLTLSVELVPSMKGTVSSVFNGMRFMGYAVSTPILLVVYLETSVFMVYVFGACTSILGLVLLRGIRYKGSTRT